MDPASHTRNSSTNSQFSKGSGYESQNSQPVLNGQNLGYNLEKDKGPGIAVLHRPKPKICGLFKSTSYAELNREKLSLKQCDIDADADRQQTN